MKKQKIANFNQNYRHFVRLDCPNTLYKILNPFLFKVFFILLWSLDIHL